MTGPDKVNSSAILPTVSIVISNYNYGRYLKQCVDSALSQTHPSEVVVVDDGSSDHSVSILESYGNLITVVHQNRLGQGAAVNNGVAVSSGEIVCLLDSDDWVRASRSAVVANIFGLQPEVDWIMHNMSVVDDDGSVLSQQMYNFSAPERLVDDLIRLGDTPGSTSGLCFRRSFLDEVGPIPPEAFPTYADGYLICSAVFLGTARTISQDLTARRQHSGSASAWSRPDAGRSLRQIVIHRGISTRAAELATTVAPRDGLDALAAGKAWWQTKAELQYCKSRPDSRINDVAKLWFSFAAAMAQSCLPLSRKLAFIARDTALVVLPRRAYLLAWWMVHYGRPRVRPKIFPVRTKMRGC